MRIAATIFSLGVGLLPVANAIKTSIYIDQVPLYSSLPSCAEEPLSAIVRAQSSGCGDGMQLTSFTCFCFDQSSMMSSIISTAVQASCAADATTTTTSPLAQVTSALEVFESYCAKSTELSLYQGDKTASVTITVAPTSPSSSITTTTSPSATIAPQNSSNTVPVAAIAAPVVIGVVAIGAVIGLVFWLRRRRGTKKEHDAAVDTAHPENLNYYPRGELGQDAAAMNEMPNGAEKYGHELESRDTARRAELDGTEVLEKKT